MPSLSLKVFDFSSGHQVAVPLFFVDVPCLPMAQSRGVSFFRVIFQNRSVVFIFLYSGKK